MAVTDEPTGPVAFFASFPPEERFSATAAEIAARLAAAFGCQTQAADDIRHAVDAAFGEALGEAAAPGIDVALRAEHDAFEAEVTCGGRVLLRCSRARSS